MYLNNIDLLKLIIPFLLSGLLYIYSDDLVKNADTLLPTIAQYKSKELDKKVKTYLQIQRENNVYNTILQHRHARAQSNQWIVEKLLYQKEHTVHTTKSAHLNRSNAKVKKYTYTLQILYPKRKVAIINATIVHEGSVIAGAKVVRISKNRVLLKTTKGYQWLSLFH